MENRGRYVAEARRASARAWMRVTRLDAEFVEPTAAIDVNVHRAR